MTEQTGSSARQVAADMFAALKQHDLDALARNQHPDVVEDFVPVGTFRGRAAVRGYFGELLAAFPDFAIEVTSLSGEGDRVFVEWRVTGTFRGSPFQGIHATGRRVELRGCDLMRFEDGLLRENTIYYDGLGFARQVGLLPRERSAADKAMTAAFNASTQVRARLHRRSAERAHAG